MPYLIILMLVGSMGGGALWYYKDTQSTIATLRDNNSKLMMVAETNQETINSMARDYQLAQENMLVLQERAKEAEEYQDELASKLRRHDLTALTLQSQVLSKRELIMLQLKSLISSKPILASSLLLPIALSSGCATIEPEVVVKTDYVVKDIPIQPQPKPLNLHRVKFYAVTPENIDDFLLKFEEEAGVNVFFALSVPDYENMSLNVAELRRYINQQKAVILYYEDSINTMIRETPEDTEEVVQEGTLNKLLEW